MLRVESSRDVNVEYLGQREEKIHDFKKTKVFKELSDTEKQDKQFMYQLQKDFDEGIRIGIEKGMEIERRKRKKDLLNIIGGGMIKLDGLDKENIYTVNSIKEIFEKLLDSDTDKEEILNLITEGDVSMLNNKRQRIV